jgi:DNA-binding transcriptional LysR family regulator
MTLTQLELFIALAQGSSFSAVAAKFAITQSSVSHTLRSLERELGVELFDRRESPPRLTPAGERLVSHARAMTGHAEAIRQEVQAEHGLKKGLLRIGSFGPSSSLRLLPRLMRKFSARHPGIELQIDEEADDVIAQWLVDHRVELGFVTLPNDRFDVVPIASDQYVAVLPKNHPLASRARIRPAQLTGERYIRCAAGCGPEIDRILQAAKSKPHEVYRMPQILSVLGLVQQGLGVSISVELAVPDSWPGVVFRPFDPPARRHVALAMLNRANLTPAAAAFVKLAEDAAI